MNDDPHKNEWDDLVRRAHGYHIRPFTPGEKAGVLWAEARIAALEKAGKIIQDRHNSIRVKGFYCACELCAALDAAKEGK
jgi:hypothetical protein